MEAQDLLELYDRTETLLVDLDAGLDRIRLEGVDQLSLDERAKLREVIEGIITALKALEEGITKSLVPKSLA